MLQIYFKGGIRTKFHSMPLLLSHILSSYVKYQLFKPPLKSRHLVTGFNYGQKRVFTQTCLLKMSLIIKHFQKGPTVYRSHGPIFFLLLLLFNYSCLPFLPIPPPHPSQTPLPPPPQFVYLTSIHDMLTIGWIMC